MLTTTTSRGEAVTLRPHTPQDAPAVVDMLSDPGTTCWLEPLPDPYLPEHAQGFIETRGTAWQDPWSGEECTLVVEAGGCFAGQVGYRPRGRSGEIGYVMTAAHTGRGIMTAAVRCFLAWVLSPQGMDQAGVSWRARRENWASLRVAWAAGFSFDGTTHGHAVDPDGTLVDFWMGSLTRGEPLTPRHPWLDTPRITIGGLLLREPLDGDVDRIVESCADQDTSRWLPTLPVPYRREDAEVYLRAVREEQALDGCVVWAVADTHDPGVLLGMVALSEVRSGRGAHCEVGYWVHPDARRRSVATVACRGATRHALLPVDEGGLGLHSVLLRAGADNVGSQKVADAAGFTRTGVDPRSELRRDGSVGDFLRYHFTVDQLEDAWAHPSSLR